MILKPLVDVISTLKDVSLNIDVYANVVWYFEDDCLGINTDGNVDHLWNGNGNTYTWYARDMEVSDDGYVAFYDADQGCGSRETIIVKLSEREV
jgi:uncharacterized protein YneR